MKHASWRYLGVIFLMMAVSWWGNAFSAPPGLTEQTSREGGVTVKVTPQNLESGAANWDFEVVLETHTQLLDQDLTKVAALIDAQGKAHLPLSWEGSPPGGHHRRGLLRFQPLVGNPAAVELRISGVGGTDIRTFRWQLR